MNQMTIIPDTKAVIYKAHKSSVGYWACAICVSNNDVSLQITHAKTIDGDGTPSYVPIKPKNVGRANETSAMEQAKLELASRVAKQLKKGYVVDIPELGAQVLNALGEKKPMLAQKYHDVKPEDIDWANAYASPKLDGHRMLNGKSDLYSRLGTVIKLPHIEQGLEEAGLRQIPVDGEVYCHGKTLQQIGSLVKKPREESLELRLHLYDVVDSTKQWVERIAPFANVKDNAGIVVLPYVKVNNPEEFEAFREACVAQQYEGAMLRHGLAGYEDDTRSRSLLKAKEYQDAEFEIIGAKQGTAKTTKAGERLEVCVYRCKTEEGKEFDCTAPGDMYEKHAAWENHTSAIGKPLTARFFNYSKDGIPQQPVALRIREDI